MNTFSRSKGVIVLLLTLSLPMVPSLLGQSPDSPDGVVMWVAEELDNGHPQVLWQALPGSYQNDLTAAIHEFAANTDPELWNGSMSALRKLQQVLDEKREFILSHPAANEVVDTSECPDCYDAVVGILDTLFNSELADLEKMKTLDVESFLSGTVARLFEQLKVASQLSSTSAGMAESWKPLGVTVVSRDGDAATLRLEAAEDQFKELDFVRVEGKWIPRDLSESWGETMTELRSQSKAASGESPEEKQQVLMMLSLAEGVLDSLLAAETQEQFNEAIQGVLGMAAGAMMEDTPEG